MFSYCCGALIKLLGQWWFMVIAIVQEIDVLQTNTYFPLYMLTILSSTFNEHIWNSNG